MVNNVIRGEIYPIDLEEQLDKLIYQQALTAPDKVAVKHNQDTITYSKLNEYSERVANFLISKNINSGDIIAVAMDRSVWMTVCLLAVIKSGAAYVPVDPTLPVDRIDYLMEDSAAKLIIATSKYTEKISHYSNTLLFNEVWENIETYSSEPVNVNRSGHDLAYILYTSGSTGRPKGVAVEHRNLYNLLTSVQKTPGMTKDDVMLGITTMSFDISELELFLPLITGAQLTIADKEIARDGYSLLELIEREKITIVQATPFTWRMIIEAGWNTRLPIKAFCGGEAMTRDLAAALLAGVKELWNMYGPTETTIYSIIKQVTPADSIITIGKPINNTRVYLVDDLLNEVPTGEVGEILIGGEGVARGYVNRAELTAEKFIADKFSGKEGYKVYRTGDLGKLLPNGEIQCLGRIDHQIKFKGHRIEPEEIEAVIKQQELVKQALVVLYQESAENLRLVAYVVPETFETTDKEALAASLKAFLKRELPDYMVPTDYVVIPAIPLMNSGKTDRKALPPPDLSSRASYVEPSTKLQKQITQIWEDNLNLKKIGINDSFFDLGGNSLIAVKTMTQIANLTGKRLSVAILFSHPSIKQVADILENEDQQSSFKSLVAIKPEGTKIPLYVIHGIGLNLLVFRPVALSLDPEQPVYGLQAQGLHGEEETPKTMEDIAAFYNSEILRHNPAGPYAIAGYSFGGYIAFEMVRQLRKMGKEVSFVGMLDTNLQIQTFGLSRFQKLLIKLYRQVPKIIFRIVSFIKDPSGNIEYFKLIRANKLMAADQQSRNVNGRDLEIMPEYMRHIADEMQEALRTYKIQPLDINIYIFKAKKRIYYIDDPIYLGWKKYATKGIKIITVPGDHHDMVTPPNAQILGSLLQKELNKIN